MKFILNKTYIKRLFKKPTHEGWLTEALLLAVILMAAATLFALRITQLEMQSLAKPHQNHDFWYVTNTALELHNLGRVARKASTAEAQPDMRDALEVRLDVLASLLTPAEFAPKVSRSLLRTLPDALQTLDKINKRVESWSYRLVNSTDPAQVTQEIVEQIDELSESLRHVVLAIHIASTNEQDQARIDQYEQFALLNWILLALLVGITVLVIKLIRDRKIMKRLASHLESLNKRLEVRVNRRTRQLAESKALLMFILDASPSEAALVNAESGDVLFINKTLLDKLELNTPPQQLFLKNLLVDTEKGQTFLEELDQYGSVDSWEAQIMPHKPQWSSLSAKLVEIEGKLAHLLWGFDVSEHRKLLSLLETQANTDSLTKLYNRRAFYKLGEQMLDSCKRYEHPCSVLMIDIDHFKQINDSHGHAVGDEAICSLSQTLRDTLRDADIIGRMGGEEFAVLLPHTEQQQALESAERVRQAVASTPVSSSSGNLQMSISIGVAVFDAQQEATLEQILITADKALYQAKVAGRNRVEI
jgi:diguanylate cyclase (GGDEF)-like protein